MKIENFHVPKKIRPYIVYVLRQWSFCIKLLGLPVKRISPEDTETYFNETKQVENQFFRAKKTKTLQITPPHRLNQDNKPGVTTYPCQDFMMGLANGRYYHNNSSVLTSEGYQLAIVSKRPEASDKEHGLFTKIYLPRPKRFKGTGLLLSTADDKNYYHCLFQIAPKLWHIQREGYDLSEIDHFFLELTNYNFQNEIIDQLGIPREKIVDVKNHGHIKVQQMLLTPPYWRPEPWICKNLKDAFVSKGSQGKKTAKRIYISRNKASYRKILNEAELLKVLGQYDFQMVQTEGMSIQEQANLYHHAETIMAPHGAALANIVFCRPQTKIIELREQSHHDSLGTVYEHLSSIGNLEHQTYLCPGFKNRFGPLPKYFDLQVNPTDIEQILNSKFKNNPLFA